MPVQCGSQTWQVHPVGACEGDMPWWSSLASGPILPVGVPEPTLDFAAEDGIQQGRRYRVARLEVTGDTNRLGELAERGAPLFRRRR
jgi:hypothetical protein